MDIDIDIPKPTPTLQTILRIDAHTDRVTLDTANMIIKTLNYLDLLPTEETMNMFDEENHPQPTLARYTPIPYLKPSITDMNDIRNTSREDLLAILALERCTNISPILKRAAQKASEKQEIEIRFGKETQEELAKTVTEAIITFIILKGRYDRAGIYPFHDVDITNIKRYYPNETFSLYCIKVIITNSIITKNLEHIRTDAKLDSWVNAFISALQGDPLSMRKGNLFAAIEAFAHDREPQQRQRHQK